MPLKRGASWRGLDFEALGWTSRYSQVLEESSLCLDLEAGEKEFTSVQMTGIQTQRKLFLIHSKDEGCRGWGAFFWNHSNVSLNDFLT